jgi:hypothetical protein
MAETRCIHSASLFDQLNGRTTMKLIMRGVDHHGVRHELHYCPKCGGFIEDGAFVTAVEMGKRRMELRRKAA